MTSLETRLGLEGARFVRAVARDRYRLLVAQGTPSREAKSEALEDAAAWGSALEDGWLVLVGRLEGPVRRPQRADSTFEQLILL